jgi:hypothetical protein
MTAITSAISTDRLHKHANQGDLSPAPGISSTTGLIIRQTEPKVLEKKHQITWKIHS